MNRWNYSNQTRENERIAQEAASKAINRTIAMVAQELHLQVPRVGTPAENREALVQLIRIEITPFLPP